MSKRQCSCGCDNFKLRLTETHVINVNMRRCRNCGHFLSEHIPLEDDKNDSRIVAEKSDAIPEDVLVVGPPQLTVNMADTSIELINYQYHMLQGWRISKLEIEHKVVWRQILGSNWSNLSADWKNFYIAAPLAWARIQSMSLEEKAAYNQNFKANLPYGYKEELRIIMEEVWKDASALREPS
jgi:hypothetical protein